jgi:hypothetical protein
MSPITLSRRSLLGSGVALAGAAAGSRADAGWAPAVNDARAVAESVGSLDVAEAFSPPAPGEVVRFIAGTTLTPNGLSAGTSSVAGQRGCQPRGGAGTFNYLSGSVEAPVGSRLTSIEFVIEGSPQVGRIALIRYVPDQAAANVYLYQQTIPAATNGFSIYTQALDEVVDGSHTYEAFYTDNGVALTNSFCNGIRYKYVPPTSGLVPITPARAYDSRLPMTPDANGVLTAGANRTISVANARNVDTGAILGALVPGTATAVAYTLTASTTSGGGFLAVNPGGTSAVSASTINWSAPNQVFANTGVVKLGPGSTLTVVAGGAGATHFIIDIVGYYL